MILMRGVTACQEMESGKKKEREYESERESELPGLFGPGPEESELSFRPVREGRGIPVCSVQGRGAD